MQIIMSMYIYRIWVFAFQKPIYMLIIRMLLCIIHYIRHNSIDITA